MAQLNILITGAGVAGCVCAYWLRRAGYNVTVMERAPELRKAGQQIDIRFSGLEIIKRMGVDAAIRAKTTKEQGLSFVDERGRSWADFPVKEGGGNSFTSEIEILRENLVKVFYDASLEAENENGGKVEYVFGDYVTAIIQSEEEEKVKVTLASGSTRDFDLVLGADGLGSKIRRLVFPNEQPIRPLGQYTAFFTIPFKESDGSFGKWYNAPGGRCIFLRPDNAGYTRAYLSIMSTKPSGYHQMGVAAQKAMYRDLFADAGWEATRVLEGMEQADDFYMTEIAQVKLPAWTIGRVALLGDAGYCPSPISGMGTTLAIIGAYILAGEIAKAGKDYKTAFSGYEEKMRPYVTKAQSLPPGAPAIANPQSRWGIKIFNYTLFFVTKSGIAGLIGKMAGGGPKEDKNLPFYDF